MKKALITLSAVAFLSVETVAGNVATSCGLGSMLIKNPNTTVAQLGVTFLNNFYGNQTFGITSGTLGCTKPSKFVKNNKLQKFVAENMDSLAIDIASGKGETLNTLASLLKISDTVAFGKKLQSNFDVIYSGSDVSSAKVIDAIAPFAS